MSQAMCTPPRSRARCSRMIPTARCMLSAEGGCVKSLRSRRVDSFSPIPRIAARSESRRRSEYIFVAADCVISCGNLCARSTSILPSCVIGALSTGGCYRDCTPLAFPSSIISPRARGSAPVRQGLESFRMLRGWRLRLNGRPNDFGMQVPARNGWGILPWKIFAHRESGPHSG